MQRCVCNLYKDHMLDRGVVTDRRANGASLDYFCSGSWKLYSICGFLHFHVFPPNFPSEMLCLGSSTEETGA